MPNLFRSWLRSLASTLFPGYRTRRARRGRRAMPRRQLRVEELEQVIVPTGGLDPIYGHLPMAFEPNVGQSDSQVQFLARGPGYGLFLTSTDAVLSLLQPMTAAEGEGETQPVAEPTVLRMHLAGSVPVQGTGADPLGGTSNYLRGDDPAGWTTDVVQYGRVVYRDVYPGITVEYHGSPAELQYDYTVAPGVDPGLIRMNFEGA